MSMPTNGNAGVDVPRLVRHVDQRTGVPQARFTTHVLGEAQIRTYTAMCQTAGRRPYELAGDILLAAIRAAQRDPEVQQSVAELSVVLDAGHDGPACRMCGCVEERACVGGCCWVSDPLMLGDLCSTCLPNVAGPAEGSGTADVSEVLEVTAIAGLLAHLPRADATELLVLARTCPADHIARYAVQADALLEGLRAELTAVVSVAHGEAQAAEAWIASLEGDDATKATVTELGVA